MREAGGGKMSRREGEGEGERVTHPIHNTPVLSDTEQRASLERASAHYATTSPILEPCVAASVALQAAQDPHSANSTKLFALEISF